MARGRVWATAWAGAGCVPAFGHGFVADVVGQGAVAQPEHGQVPEGVLVAVVKEGEVADGGFADGFGREVDVGLSGVGEVGELALDGGDGAEGVVADR